MQGISFKRGNKYRHSGGGGGGGGGGGVYGITRKCVNKNS